MQFVQFLGDYSRKQQTEKPQAMVVQALAALMVGNQTKKLTVQEVTVAVNQLCVDRGAAESSAKAVGALLRSVGFKPTRTGDGYRFTVARRELEVLLAKYPMPPDEAVPGQIRDDFQAGQVALVN